MIIDDMVSPCSIRVDRPQMSALSELQTTKRLICSKTNAGNSLKADNPAKTKAELSKISRLQYIVKT